MAVKGLYWTILMVSWLKLAFSESIMDYLRNREDLSQVSYITNRQSVSLISTQNSIILSKYFTIQPIVNVNTDL